MGLKKRKSEKKFVHALFNPLSPSVSSSYLPKKSFLIFAEGIKRKLGGNGLIAYGSYFDKATCLTF